MSSLQSMKTGKLLSCRIHTDSGTVPAVLKKIATRVDGLVDFEIITTRRLAGQLYLLDGKLKAEPADVIIKHKGYTLDD